MDCKPCLCSCSPRSTSRMEPDPLLSTLKLPEGTFECTVQATVYYQVSSYFSHSSTVTHWFVVWCCSHAEKQTHEQSLWCPQQHSPPENKRPPIFMLERALQQTNQRNTEKVTSKQIHTKITVNLKVPKMNFPPFGKICFELFAF